MSWLKLKSAVMDAVCRRKLATPGEYSFVSKASLKECSGKVAMLDLLKLEGCAWAVIASCKGKKEDVKAFEKKVKAQFSLVPFEEVTPVVEEVNLEEGDAKEAKKNDIDNGDTKKNGKDGEKAEEAENWGTVHDTPVTDDMEDDAETDLDKTEPFKEVEKNEEDKEKEKLKLREKMETERKRAEVKEKEDEEKRKAEEIKKAKEKKEKEEKRKAELREKEEKRKQELKEMEEKRNQEMKEKEETRKKEELRKAEEKKKAEAKKKEEEQNIAEAKDKAEEDKVGVLKRKSKPVAGPARKLKKVDHSKPDDYWKVLRSRFMVGESALTLEELIETDVIERGVLVFLLDVSKTDEFFQDYFNKFENFESAERLLVENRFSGVYLVTFEESESADDFVELQRTLWDGTPLRKVGMREFCRDRYCEQRMMESLRNLDLIKAIDEKMNFPERRKAGTTQAHCLVAYFNYSGEQINDEELLESLPEDVEEIETVFEVKGEDDLWQGVFILICCSDQAAMDLSKKEVIRFNKHNLETELLSSMLVKKRFSMKAKNFKDDPAFKDKDNNRRLVLPSSKLSNDAAEALEKHIRETRTGVQAWHKTVCNLHIITFHDTASASGALQVKEEDRGLVERPEQLMLLPEYMEAWQRALDRQKEREETAVKEAEADVGEEEVEQGEGVQSEDAFQDEVKSKEEEMEVENDEESKNGVESSNGHESNTVRGNIENGHTEMFKCFAFCKGFTDEDCDVEEYFEENHENVEQVWQRGEGDGCEVYVKFKDEVSVQRFLTLNYVRYRTRPITVSSVKEERGLAEYLSC